MTDSLMAEWRKHSSPMMSRWLVQMESAGRTKWAKDKRVSDLRRAIKNVGDAGIREALEKDAHVSETAIMNGFPVISQDDKQKKFLGGLADTYLRAGRVQWINPVTSDGDWVAWLQTGCVDYDVFTCHRPTG